MLRRKRQPFIAGSLLLALVLSCADSDHDEGGNGKFPSVEVQDSDCPRPGPVMASLLLDADNEIRAELNPCIPLDEIQAELVSFVPSTRQSRLGQFIQKFGTVTNRLSEASDFAHCGYKTDNLAIGLYQHHDPAWSVGAAFVVDGSIDAVLETSQCFLREKAESIIAILTTTGEQPAIEPKPDFCFNARRERIGGTTYTSVYAGSSNIMCAKLTAFYEGDLDQRPDTETEPVEPTSPESPPSTPAPTTTTRRSLQLVRDAYASGGEWWVDVFNPTSDRLAGTIRCTYESPLNVAEFGVNLGTPIRPGTTEAVPLTAIAREAGYGVDDVTAVSGCEVAQF